MRGMMEGEGAKDENMHGLWPSSLSPDSSRRNAAEQKRGDGMGGEAGTTRALLGVRIDTYLSCCTLVPRCGLPRCECTVQKGVGDAFSCVEKSPVLAARCRRASVLYLKGGQDREDRVLVLAAGAGV